MGVNDYLMRPVDRNELLARVRTQLRKKRYSDKLRHNVQLSLEMAITDPLTGLHNRRYMASHLDTLMKSASAAKPISFLIMDIDYFKAVNDTHGHDVGDEVLREFANRISANVRGIDLACRHGGEEFVVVMPDTDAGFAFTVAERLRQSIESTPIKISRAPERAQHHGEHRYRIVDRRRRRRPTSCCGAPTRRSIAPSAKAATGSSPKRPEVLILTAY